MGNTGSEAGLELRGMYDVAVEISRKHLEIQVGRFRKKSELKILI